MTDRSPTPKPSWRSAALGAVGGLMVLLPLGEVMRHQSQEMEQLSTERALLDPLSQAVAVQRGLLSHGELCQRLLAGRTQLETERQLRQAVVDNALWDLKSTLSVGLWVTALGEAGQLTVDWHQLTQRIRARQVDAKTAQADHRLLIEQTLQVMDLVTAAAPAAGVAAAPYLLALQQGAATLPGSESLGTAASQLARGSALDRLQEQLQGHSQALDQRITGLQAARAWAGAVAAALALLAAAALLGWRQRAGAPTPAPPRVGEDGVRLGSGRRATDADRAPDAAGRLLWQLRNGPAPSTTAYSDTLPPTP